MSDAVSGQCDRDSTESQIKYPRRAFVRFRGTNTCPSSWAPRVEAKNPSHMQLDISLIVSYFLWMCLCLSVCLPVCVSLNLIDLTCGCNCCPKCGHDLCSNGKMPIIFVNLEPRGPRDVRHESVSSCAKPGRNQKHPLLDRI